MFGVNDNKSVSSVNKDYKTQGKEIVKLSAMIGEIARVWGFIITKDAGYGEGVCLCGDSCLISLPKRYVEGFKNGSPEDRAAIVTGSIYIYNIHEVAAGKPGQKDTVAFDMGTKEQADAWMKAQASENITV